MTWYTCRARIAIFLVLICARFASFSRTTDVVDIKPENMEELTEVITSVQFHPSNCHTLVFSSSRGAIKCCDTRASALCKSYARTYAEPQRDGANSSKSFIADILNSISDVT